MRFLRLLIKNWNRHQNSRAAAAIAFYSLFSLSPCLVLGLSIASTWAGREDARALIIRTMEQLAGKAGEAIGQYLSVASGQPSLTWSAQIVSWVFLLWGASRIFVQMQSALDNIWEEKAARKSGAFVIKRSIKSRLSVFLIVPLVVLLLLGSVLLDVALFMFSAVTPLAPLFRTVGGLISSFLPFCLLGTLFACLYRLSPIQAPPWKNAWIGAGVAALGFAILRQFMGLYLSTIGLESIHGAAGSLVAFLLWIYLNGHLFLLGAEITQALSFHKEA